MGTRRMALHSAFGRRGSLSALRAAVTRGTATRRRHPLSTAVTSSGSITDSQSCTFVNLRDGFSKFHDHWSPKIVGEVNGMHVKLVNLEGDFDWHHHENEDELFMVVN